MTDHRDEVDDEWIEHVEQVIEEERDILDRLADDPPATDDAQPEYQDDAIDIGRNPDHPRLAIQPSPWDADKLLLWSIHDGEKWTEGTYLRADEARRLADVLTTAADELDDADGDANDAPDDSYPPGRPDYYDENPGWADDLPDLGENG
jgi:hypothetical protein